MARLKISVIRGFSLLEWLICLSIVIIFFQFSSHNLLIVTKKAKIEQVKNELISIVAYARNTAWIARKKVILVADPNWSNVKLYSYDDYHTGLYNQALYEWQLPSEGLQIEWIGFQSRHALIFLPDVRQATLNGHFKITSSGIDPIYLTLNRMGQVTKSI